MTDSPDPAPPADGPPGPVAHYPLSIRLRETVATALYELQRRDHEPDFVDRPEIVKAGWRRTAERFAALFAQQGGLLL